MRNAKWTIAVVAVLVAALVVLAILHGRRNRATLTTGRTVVTMGDRTKTTPLTSLDERTLYSVSTGTLVTICGRINIMEDKLKVKSVWLVTTNGISLPLAGSTSGLYNDAMVRLDGSVHEILYRDRASNRTFRYINVATYEEVGNQAVENSVR